ncbi:MAG: DUF1540 domain-containing protein [Emergencia sp.]
MDKNCNHNIHCTVAQCLHNAREQQYCTLDAITVGTHEANPTQSQCTDCMSFRLR